MTQAEIREEILSILKSPTFWDRVVIDELGKKIVGEIPSREILFTCGMGSLVVNSSYSSFNSLIHSESSAGKDYTTKNVLKIFPQTKVFSRTRISPTVLNYWKPFLKIGQETWDGCILYLPDIGDSVINSDALKLMCSDGSHITITDKGLAVDIEIKGKPVIFTTTANSTPNDEMLNRFSIVHLDETEEQTRKILEMQGKSAEEGNVNEYSKEIIEAIACLKRYSVKIPFARKISKIFPIEKIRQRRNFERFLDYIKAVTVFHQFQRERDGGVIIAEEKDYDKARDIFMNLQCGMASIPLNRKQKEIISVLENIKEPIQLSDLHKSLKKYISLQHLRPYLDSLVNLRLVDKHYGIDSCNREVIKYCLGEDYLSFEPIKLPTSLELDNIEDSNSSIGNISNNGNNGSNRLLHQIGGRQN